MGGELSSTMFSIHAFEFWVNDSVYWSEGSFKNYVLKSIVSLFETVNVSPLPLMSQGWRRPFWQGKHYYGCAVWADAVSWNITVRHCLLPQFFQTRNVITVESGCHCFFLRGNNNGRGDATPPSSNPRLAKCWPSPFYSSSLPSLNFFKNLALKTQEWSTQNFLDNRCWEAYDINFYFNMLVPMFLVGTMWECHLSCLSPVTNCRWDVIQHNSILIFVVWNPSPKSHPFFERCHLC